MAFVTMFSIIYLTMKVCIAWLQRIQDITGMLRKQVCIYITQVVFPTKLEKCSPGMKPE